MDIGKIIEIVEVQPELVPEDIPQPVREPVPA